jgi:hypothetical protein
MSESAWQQARLIPTSGINGAQEQERRATSALLAVMTAVKEYGRTLTKGLGAHTGDIETFIEVEFDLDGKKVIPDGLIRVTRGSRVWAALVEVKTGRNELQSEQLENYLEVARRNGLQALLTISNQTSVADGVHPARVDKRKLKHVALHHLAWSEVLSRAVVEKEHRGVADPDQAYILGELIRYLEHPRSGALEFEDMGSSWVPVRNAVADGTLRQNNPEAADMAGRFEALLRFAALQLGTRLGTDVTVAHSRKELSDPSWRISSQVTSLVEHGRLQGALRIPNAVGPIDITVDLRARLVICSVDIDAPKEGRPTTKVNWLVRQLKQTNDRARLECNAMNQRGNGSSDLLGRVRENPELLILDPTKTIRSFTVALNSSMGLKSGRGQGTFIDGLLAAIDTFYGEVLQSLKAWAAKPPRMREQTDTSELAKDQEVSPALVATALSSQDGPTLEEANSLTAGSAQ